MHHVMDHNLFTQFYSLSLVITNSDAMNNLSVLTLGRCTGVCVPVVAALPPPPLPYISTHPSVGAEGGGAAGRVPRAARGMSDPSV